MGKRSASFDDKLLARLDKLDPAQVESVLARLIGQKQFLTTIFDHLDEGVLVTDEQLKLLFTNRRARLMLGLPREERDCQGEDLTRRFGPGHALGETFDSLRGHLRRIDGYECPWGPGEERTLSLSTLPMRAPQSPAAKGGRTEPLLIILLRDVTEHHRHLAEQARARRLASMATLTSGIAHEIKNPLNSLNIHAQLLQGEVDKGRRTGRGPDPARTERASRVIMEESQRLSRIVEEFLQAARPRSPQFALNDLRPLVEKLERIFRPECEARGIALVVRVDPELPPVMIDDHLMLQALRNLLRNAVEALTERIEQASASHEAFLPRVELQAELSGEVVNLTVHDNGPGIAQGVIDQIFEPYFTTKHGGTGLGLMVVYRIVTEHRGLLHVDSEAGHGTTFLIALPLHQRPIRLIEDDAGGAAQAVPQSQVNQEQEP